jgi:hypothetical protein
MRCRTQPPGLSRRDLACLRALVAAVHVLAGTLDSSWFVVLEHEIQITFLPHAVLPRLVRHSLALVHLLVCRAHGVEHRLKGRWNSNDGGIRLQQIHFLRTSIPRACKLPYSGYLMQASARRLRVSQFC